MSVQLLPSSKIVISLALVTLFSGVCPAHTSFVNSCTCQVFSFSQRIGLLCTYARTKPSFTLVCSHMVIECPSGYIIWTRSELAIRKGIFPYNVVTCSYLTTRYTDRICPWCIVTFYNDSCYLSGILPGSDAT